MEQSELSGIPSEIAAVCRSIGDQNEKNNFGNSCGGHGKLLGYRLLRQ